MSSQQTSLLLKIIIIIIVIAIILGPVIAIIMGFVRLLAYLVPISIVILFILYAVNRARSK